MALQGTPEAKPKTCARKTGRSEEAPAEGDPPSGASIGEAVASEPYKARMKSS
jgi:hypothetical protein